MPAPVVYIVPAIITAVVTGYLFHQFVYEPHIAPVLERMAEDFLAHRRARSRHLATPVSAGHPPPGSDDNDIPLNERTSRRRTRSSASTSDESGDEESAPLLGARSSTTAREGPNLNENVNVNATLRRRPITAVPIVDNTIQEHSAPLLRAHSYPIAREESNDVNSTATLLRRPVAFDNNDHFFGSEHHHHHHQVTPVLTQDNRPRLEPTVTVPPSPAPSGVSRSDVHDWRRTVALHGDRRRHGQGQPMRPAVDRRPLPSPSTIPAVHFVPTLPPVASPPPPPAVFHVLDEPNPGSLPQTPIYPTHVITDSSVPSTPSSTMSGGRNVMFTPPPQMSPLRSSTISTNAGANSVAGANPSEISVLDPWNGVFSSKDGGLGVSVSVPSMAQSTTTASFQTNGSGDSSSTSQLLVPPPNASGAGAPPQLPPFSPLSSMHASTRSAHSNQPALVKSPPLPTLQSPPPPQTPRTPPYLLTPSAQHPHHVHYPAPPNTIAVVSSPTTTRGATTAATRAPAAPTQPQLPISPTLTSPVLSLSQSYPISLDQEQGIEIVSNPTPSVSPFRSPTFSDPFDIVIPGSPEPFGSPGSPQSPFIPLSIPPLPISPPLPPSAGANGTGGGGHQRQRRQRQPLDLFGSAGSVTTTIRPPPQSPSASTNMFYSFTNDASTTRQTSPPARPSPAVQSGGMLSFPPEANHNHNQQQQHRFASPGIMSPMLSELDFVSEFGGSELGSNDDIGSESSWSSARF